MNMLKAGAKALMEMEGGEWGSKRITEGTRDFYRRNARACWSAMVGAMSDEQLARFMTHGFYFSEDDYVTWRCDYDQVRAALLELLEVSHD